MEFNDRVSAYPNRYVMRDESGNTSYVYLERADEPTVPGTPLNAETFNKMAEDIGAASLPLSGGTMTGKIFGVPALNGARIGGFRFDNNTTVTLDIGDSRWAALIAITQNSGDYALYFPTGKDGNSLNGMNRIYGSASDSVRFTVANNTLTITCSSGWSTGWYIATSLHQDLYK